MTLDGFIDLFLWYHEANKRSLSRVSNHCTVEVIFMRGLKRDLWKAGMVIAGMLLLLVLMAWIPVSAAGAEMRASGLAAMVMVQATPTEDATVTALNKEQLTLQVKQLQNQLQNQNNWLANNSTALIAAITTLIVALFGIYQWTGNRRDALQKELTAQGKELEDRKAERERRDEEQQRWLKNQEAEREKQAEGRFQSAIEGLSSEREEAKVGAAILLRTFLRPGYEQFYTQSFDLVAAHLCPSRAPNPPEDPKAPLTLTTLRQALIVAFKEAFPPARSQHTGSPQSLDASYIQLDNAYLVRADLKQAWMPQASCREADLSGADLREANLSRANLSGTDLREADLSGANLREADLIEANLRRANLRRTDLREADLSGANLFEANLRGADLREAGLSGANLGRADLSGADLSKANLFEAILFGANLNGANIEDAFSLKDTDIREVKGLTKEQRASCKTKGVIIDEDPTTSSSQSTVAPPPVFAKQRNTGSTGSSSSRESTNS